MARYWRLPRPAHGWSRRRRPFLPLLARSPRRFPRDLDDRRLGVEAFDLETGDALVVGGDVFQLLQREHIGDDVVAVGRALFDHLHYLLWTVAAVEHHEIGGRRAALGFIRDQGGVGCALCQDLAGDDAGVQDRLRRAVGADRI